MKLSFSEVKKIQRMSQNELTRYLGDIGVQAYRQGVEDGEKELDEATAAQWVEYIRKTPTAQEIFTIADGPSLESAFEQVVAGAIEAVVEDCRRFHMGKAQVDLVGALLRERFTPDILWGALEQANKIKTEETHT